MSKIYRSSAFELELFGGFSPDASAVLEHLRNHSRLHQLPFHRGGAVKALSMALAITLQRGNALVMREG